jgi:endoglucanase
MRAIAASTMTVVLACGTLASMSAEPSGPPTLKVDGTRIKTLDGKVVRLRGLNVPSLEWGQGEHLFDSLRVAIDEWGANILRLPLSQDRWFGRGKEQKDGGAHYRKTVHEFVTQAAAKRCYVILDLHWSDVGVMGEHNAQHKMPDDHSQEFWGEVAAAFANHPAVLFDLYNEPHSVSWDVWRDGGKVVEDSKSAPGGKVEFHTPGLQKLLAVCRSKGAKNVVVAGGLDYGYDLSGVAKGHALADANGNGIVYDTHLYPMKKDFERHVTPALAKYAVIAGEVGNGSTDWLPKTMEYIDRHELAWVAWCLHPSAKPCLIKDWKYTPTSFGEIMKKALHETPAAR